MTPTETTAPRLIDANALLEALNNKRDNDDFASFKDAIRMLESAPTVETTDDVFERLPTNCRYTFEQRVNNFIVWTRDWSKDKVTVFKTGKSYLEALKKLEASLNPK